MAPLTVKSGSKVGRHQRDGIFGYHLCFYWQTTIVACYLSVEKKDGSAG